MKVFVLFVEKKRNGIHYEKDLENIVQKAALQQIHLSIK